jgi:predicted permease
MPPWQDTGRILLVKFLILPLVTLLFLSFYGARDTYPLLANLLMIQSSSPAATGIILQVRAYGGDYQKTGNIMFISYLFCMFSLPFWLALWQTI